LDDLLATADVVTCHLPLTPATKGLLDRRRLGSMKRGAVLVNTSRGAIVDEVALYERLAAGHLAGAALDVRENEPPGDSPLHALSNVVLAPHVAGWTHEAQARVISTVAGDVDRVLRGGSLRYFWRGGEWWRAIRRR